MKTKLFLLILSLSIIIGCDFNPTQTPKTQEVKIKIEGVDSVKLYEEGDEDKVSKTMQIHNNDMVFSNNCKIHEGVAYLSITSISSYNSEDLWRDFRLMKLKGIKEVIIYLNSPGGEAFQGLALTDEIRMVKDGIKVTIEGRGIIASAAIPVFLAADKRICSKNTVFMIHPANLQKWGMFTEGLKELESQAKMITLLNENYAEAVSSKTNLKKAEVLEMMKRDNWFTASEAKTMGFVDDIK